MAKKIIRTGTTADPIGDSLKNAFVKVNDNFTELYNALGLDADTLNIGAFEFTGSTMTTTDSSAIVIDQATTITSNLSVGGDLLPQTALGGDLGSSTLPWRSLYVSNNTIYIGGTAVGLDANGNLTVNGGQVNAPSSTLVNGANTVSLGSDGALTVPGDINLSGGTITQYSQNGLTGLKLVANADQGQNVTIMGTGNNTFPILNYVGTTLSGITIGTPEGDWDFMNGNLTIPGDIRSDSNINIEINLADSTKRIWQFGEDGELTTPGGIQVAGILKIDDGVHEQFQAKVDATGVVTHDCSSGHIFYHTSPDANWTANFTNLNLSTTYATAITLIIVQGATGYYPSAVQIAGSAQTINWQGNVNPTVSTSRTDVVTFSIINNSGTYTVLGQLTGF